MMDLSGNNSQHWTRATGEFLKDRINLHLDFPAAIAQQLKSGEADLALIPTAEIKNIPGARVVTDYCIGADGPVGSVCLYADVPVEEVKEIFLDYQSRTSVQL